MLECFATLYPQTATLNLTMPKDCFPEEIAYETCMGHSFLGNPSYMIQVVWYLKMIIC